MSNQSELRERITNQIVEALKSGETPFWRRPWRQCENSGYPTNAITGKKYRGINFLLLSLAAQMRGYESRYWATYPQWKNLGGQVRKGERGVQIVLWKPIRKVTVNGQGEEEVGSYPLLRTWTVFNVAACDGDLDKYRATAPSNGLPFEDYCPAEAAFAATGADIRYGAGRAFYSPDGDYIQLPPKSAFEQAHDYYAVLAHESVHWSGAPHRLNRLDKLARFGSETYAMEELVAELGSAFLLAELGVPQSDDLSNVVAYLADWLKVLERDAFAIFTASAAGSKAADFILGFSRKDEGTESEVGEPVAAAG